MNTNILLVLASVFYLTDAYHYLLVSPIFGYSHIKFMGKIADVLADGGHKVTIFRPVHTDLHIPKNQYKNPGIKVIDYFPENYDEMRHGCDELMTNLWDFGSKLQLPIEAVQFGKQMRKIWNNTNHYMLKDKKLHKELIDMKFDAIIAETFDTSTFYLNEILKIPSTITVWSSVRQFATETAFGASSTLGYVPGEFSSLIGEEGFLDRLNDVFCTASIDLLIKRLFQEQHNNYASILDFPVPHWTDLMTKSPYYFINSNPYLDFPLALPHNIVRIGGFTVGRRHDTAMEKVPEEYEKILSERPTTVLISFGSVTKSSDMPKHYKDGLRVMFNKLSNITFIWKYEKDEPEFRKSLPDNVHLKKWVPQPVLLADKRIKLFITHSGLGSTTELAYSGKPALTIPLFADQPHNAMMLMTHGGSQIYRKHNLVDGNLLAETINEMITNDKYRKNAEHLSDVLNEQPIEPKKILLSHMEFAVKFPNLKSLLPPIAKTGYIDYYYLDIIAFAFVVCMIVIFTVYRLLSCLIKRVFCSSPVKVKLN